MHGGVTEPHALDEVEYGKYTPEEGMLPVEGNAVPLALRKEAPNCD
jgi:hypothetical protein